MRDLHHGVVPVAVHQVVSGICGCLVQILIAVRRTLDGALDSADIHYFLLIRRQLEFTDSSRHVRVFPKAAHLPSVCLSAQTGRPDLASHKEDHPFPVRAPSCVVQALSGFGNKLIIRAVMFAYI